MKKKLIIFDLDGVLFNSSKLVSEYTSQRYPTLTQAEALEMLSGNFHVALENLKLKHKHVEETPEERELLWNAFSLKKSQSPLFPGIFDLLQSLHKAGNILSINTSALDRNCLPLLEKSNIKDLFDNIATKEMSKSKVEKFKILEEKYKLPKEDILFITDTLGDLREADEAGIPTIAVTYGAHDRSYFTREEHKNLIAIVDTVEELKKL